MVTLGMPRALDTPTLVYETNDNDGATRVAVRMASERSGSTGVLGRQ